VIGVVAGAALGTGAVVGTLIGAVGCLVYAYLLNAGVLMPTVTTSFTLTVVAAVLCGLQGGLFYAFSTAVMIALARQPHPSGMATMQTNNVVVFNPWFGGAFSLVPVACALAMVTALARWPAPDSPWVMAGGAIFLIGTLDMMIAVMASEHTKRAAGTLKSFGGMNKHCHTEGCSTAESAPTEGGRTRRTKRRFRRLRSVVPLRATRL
jgi:uncharacterized membrane protein